MRKIFKELSGLPKKLLLIAVGSAAISLILPAGIAWADDYFMGKVGIGTTTPAGILQISKGGNLSSAPVANNSWLNIGNSLLFDTNQIEQMNDILYLNYGSPRNVSIAYGGGNVGIGIISPAKKLSVSMPFSNGIAGYDPNGQSVFNFSLPANRTNNNVNLFDFNSPGNGTRSNIFRLYANTDASWVAANAISLWQYPSDALNGCCHHHMTWGMDSVGKDYLQLEGSLYVRDDKINVVANKPFGLDSASQENGRFVITSDGKLGFNASNPTRDIDISATSIKLGLEKNGGGQLILASNPNDNRIFFEGFSKDASSSASEMLFTGRFAGAIPKLSFITSKAYIVSSYSSLYTNSKENLTVEGSLLASSLKVIGSNGSPVKVISSANTAPGQHIHFLADYVKQASSTDVKEIHGYNGQILSYDWYSKWDGSNKFLMRLNKDGNLGIGATVPGARLSVNANDPAKVIELYSGGSTKWNVGLRNAAGDFLDIGDNSNKRFVIDKMTGNIGVGTTTPAQKLDVTGNIKLSGSIVSDGDICIGKCD